MIQPNHAYWMLKYRSAEWQLSIPLPIPSLQGLNDISPWVVTQRNVLTGTWRLMILNQWARLWLDKHISTWNLPTRCSSIGQWELMTLTIVCKIDNCVTILCNTWRPNDRKGFRWQIILPTTCCQWINICLYTSHESTRNRCSAEIESDQSPMLYRQVATNQGSKVKFCVIILRTL